MCTRIDVRRTSGGLRLFVHPPGASQWTTRLPYPHAENLIAAIRTHRSCTVRTGSDATLAYLPDGSDTEDATLACLTGEPTGDLRNATHQLHLSPTDRRTLSDTLRAHLPDRMTPLDGSTEPSMS
ncbi:hypothetical protein F0L68_00425 [Solihabitans fulvus]|uniref:Uncharacterized protein n=1 Tax=Solihabitans fulvus TaxID=1892852 RepID=A0A5B2XU57_9PSEU|nr:hypothetical protein [Solihabitans fulvus]KAA2267036.1 hypothetical protein F0L68_00425 [Solihabitans fulvus]